MKRFLSLSFWSIVLFIAVHQALSIKSVKGFVKKFWSSSQKSASLSSLPRKSHPQKNAVTLYLKNGGIISGELLRDTEQGVTLLWQGGEVAFSRQEIEKLQKGEFHAEKEGMLFPAEPQQAWPYKNAVVIHLKDQRILDEEITAVTKDKIILKRELEEGGIIEQELDRSRVEFLAFKPVQNQKTLKIEESLRTQFPKMRWLREGAFTLITDSYATWVQEYRKTLRELATDYYLAFLPLLEDREPNLGHFVVIFDEWKDFITYAATDGVPGWAVAGYFSPDSEVLFLFNMLGDRFSNLLEKVLVGRAGHLLEGAVEGVKGKVDKRYHVFIEGQAHETMKKFSAYHSILRGQYREQTVATLRHEMTHELFHNYGLQSIVVSKLHASQKQEAEKKRSFLEEEDVQKKRELLFELAHLRRSKPIQVEAANSWFVEGLAAYMEEVPLGETNKRWLFLFQEARRKKALFPIEHLTVYKVGSFPGISWEAMQYAYAQSWAFVHFLMHRYPDRFMKYLERMGREKPTEDQDIQWLLGALEKDLRSLEGEFLEYMQQFPELEDPFLEQFDTMLRIFQG